jgi:exopolysaccharide biosynthesis polyprenyl glycosylphosphotransferase
MADMGAPDGGDLDVPDWHRVSASHHQQILAMNTFGIGTRERRRSGKLSVLVDRPSGGVDRGLLSQEAFLRMLGVERKRVERSHKTFLLMLLDKARLSAGESDADVLQRAGEVISASIRETDVSGWYKNKLTVGVIFTEIRGLDKESIQIALSTRVMAVLREDLDQQEAETMRISFYAFPDDWDETQGINGANAALYPDVNQQDPLNRFSRSLKRIMDIVGCIAALIALSPLFLLVAIAIKLTSKGPVFFKQTRVGKLGSLFTFLKFRSMHVQNDSTVHREFVTRFIAGKLEDARQNPDTRPVYKITVDPRLTPIGRFLRKTSIDELPQLWNVLKGQMSLVGPRPPVPYELASYELWHRRRLLEVKPGMTGLWQIHGRSRTTFDDMVRLDLRYAKNWSLWLDIRILLRTPQAVLSCEGAY